MPAVMVMDVTSQKTIANPLYTIFEDVLGLDLVGFDTSKDIWNALVETCSQQSQEHRFQLAHALTSLKKNDEHFDVTSAGSRPHPTTLLPSGIP